MVSSRDRRTAAWATLWLGLGAALGGLACSPAGEREAAAGREPAAAGRCMPAALDGPDTALRIDRRAESARALELIAQVEGWGLRAAAAGVYEYSVFRNKPLFYFALGEGAIDAEARLSEVVAAFGGREEPAKPARSEERDGVRFQCREFSNRPGLVGLSAACVFGDGSLAGFGVRTDGGDTPDALRLTSHALAGYRHKARAGACPDAARLAEQARPRRDRDGVATEAVAAVRGYECDTLAGLFPDRAARLFETEVTPYASPNHSPSEWVCFVLGTLEYPLAEEMRIEVLEAAPDSARLRVSQPGPRLLGRTVGLGREAELVLLREGGAWKLDPAWAVRVVQDHRAKLDVAGMLSNVQGSRRDGSFAADRAELQRRSRIVPPTYVPGLAGRDAEPGLLHVTLGGDGRWACVSVRSASGTWFLGRVDEKGWSTARLAAPPAECPDRSVGQRW